MKTIGVFFTFIILLVLSCIFQGFVLSKLWGWFIVLQFNLAPLNITIAVGLITTLRMINPSYSLNILLEQSKEPCDKFGKALGALFLTPLTAFFIGWVITLFI